MLVLDTNLWLCTVPLLRPASELLPMRELSRSHCLPPLRNMAACSSSSSSSSSISSSTSSPSAVSWSGGVIHSLGTMQGKANPTEAARLSHVGAGFPVSRSQRYEVKWLQLFVKRLYEVP